MNLILEQTHGEDKSNNAAIKIFHVDAQNSSEDSSEKLSSSVEIVENLNGNIFVY